MITIKDSTRLSFRLMGPEDAQALWELDQDPAVMHFINGGKPNSMTTINEVFLPRMQSYTNPDKGWGIWQVCDKNSQEYLGWVLVRPMSFFTEQPDECNLYPSQPKMQDSAGIRNVFRQGID